MATRTMLCAFILLLNTNFSYGFALRHTAQNSYSYDKISVRKFAQKPYHNNANEPRSNRRKFLTSTIISTIVGVYPNAGIAASKTAPKNLEITTDEFETLLKDSAKSVLQIEFSTPTSEKAEVTLIDGTTFQISDLLESPYDPRSPLRLAARCRDYNVKVKTQLTQVSLNAGGGTKKRVYMNDRVKEAARKEEEKRIRLIEDEEERLKEVGAYELSEKEKSIAKREAAEAKAKAIAEAKAAEEAKAAAEAKAIADAKAAADAKVAAEAKAAAEVEAAAAAV
mmetsp:Transcript_38552/g.44926  ORF Transcript_38552/g.44926 Transcript_38552/m.44926 type:complete len:281 (-) Transcript_38552:435-1277(-)